MDKYYEATRVQQFKKERCDWHSVQLDGCVHVCPSEQGCIANGHQCCIECTHKATCRFRCPQTREDIPFKEGITMFFQKGAL